MKRFLVVLAVLLIAALSLGKATEVTFWYALSSNTGVVFKGLVDEFNASQDEIFIDAIFSGKYADTAQKVTAALAANQLPDGGIVPAGPIFTGARGNYALYDYIESDSDFDMADFYDAMWDYSMYDGKICAIPYNISTPVFYYNKDLMKEAGLDPENPPSNWDELLEAAKKISALKEEYWGFDTKDTPWIFKAFLLQNGCEIIDPAQSEPLFDRAAGIEAAEYWKKLIDEKAMPIGLHNMAEKMFLGGTLGFYIGSSSRVGKWQGNTSFEFGAAYLPGAKRRAVPIGGAVAVLFPKDKKTDEATYKFIKWLTLPENVAKFSMATGYIPTRKSALETPEMKEFFQANPMFEIAFSQLQFAHAYWHFDQMGNMDGLLWESLENIEREIMTPEESMKWAAEELRKEIEASK